MEKKKKWTEPTLTVLVRRNPEEGILGACKDVDSPTGQAEVHNACIYAAAPCTACQLSSTT